MKHLPLKLTGFVLAAFVAAAHANVYTVGTPSGPGQPCTHGTIQSAINAANSHAGPDTIRLTRSLTYAPEANTINTAQELTIEGGYATCAQATPDNTRTVVSGAGGAHAPVFTITAPTGALIHLRWLEISGGDVEAAGQGGGIRFDGDGILDISDSLITQNTAGYGGGIYAHGTHSNAELVIGANVLVTGNTAHYDGGGVYSSELETSMTAPGSVIFNNKAIGVASGSYTGGYGGGLYIHAGDRHSYAYVGSGLAGIGAIALNSARYGGGVAIGGHSTHSDRTYAELHMFTTDPEHPARIGGNSASIEGGAVYAHSFRSTIDGRVSASVEFWGAVIDDNIAPDGAVAFLVGSTSALGDVEPAIFFFSGEAQPAGSVQCTVRADCGRISNNATMDGSNQTDGALIRGATEAWVQFEPIGAAGGVIVTGNRGGRLFYDGGDTGRFFASNALIAANQFSHEIVRLSDRGMDLEDSTIAGNTVGAGHLFTTFDAAVSIKRSVLWQPGLVMLDRNGGSMKVDHVLASEIESLGGNFGGGGDCGGGVCAIRGDPQFVDPEHGDYSPRISSPAIDRAPNHAVLDAAGKLRGRWLPIVRGSDPSDIGAYERQSVQPIVLNGYFDPHDLRLWSVFSGTWDGTQNAAGDSGSGAWKMHRDVTPPVDPARPTVKTAGEYVAGEQCIRLPGPGRYLLNGWGKGGGNFVIHDSAVLAWEYRRNGTADCTGMVDAQGETTLSSSNNWVRPAAPATIFVPEADFYASSPTLKVRLLGRTNAPAGTMTVWFDGIALLWGCDDGPDTVFCNGFELE